MTTKKYTLFKVQDGVVPPCAFFASPQGCKNGDKCKFAHVLPGSSDTPAVSRSTSSNQVSNGKQHSISSSDISSESETEDVPITITKKSAPPTAPPVTDDPFSDPFCSPGVNPTPAHSQPAKAESAKKRKRNDDKIYLTPNKQNASETVASNNTPIATSTTKKEKKKAKIVEKQSSFRDLDLPVATFSIPNIPGTESSSPVPTYASLAQKAIKPSIPIPSSTPEGLKWQNAVLETRKSPRYASDFDFQRMKQQELDNGIHKTWIKARSFGDWCKGNPHAIAIDCEMCETKCPTTGASNHKALCRLSVVNAVNPEEVLIDTLVKPDWPVVDHRSRINGIQKTHLEEVAFTLEHAQKFMRALCSEETVIIGHAVHNDLAALNMEHYCNVDSAFLFTVKDEPNATPSLRDLAMGICQREMPDTHDSVNDARVALLCLEEGYLKKNGKPEPVPRSFPPKKKSSCELLVHRIPKGLKPEHIQKMFLTHSSIQTTEVAEIEFGKDSGKTLATFASADHANLAFKSIEGEEKPDKTGRMQKRVYLKSGGYVQIRKMVAPKKK
jgi:RNA exonuclease 1